MKKVSKIFVAAVAVMGIAACSHNDLYDEGQIAANEAAQKKAETLANMEAYKANFEKVYGKVAPTQSWDFTTAGRYFATRAGEEEITTELVTGLDFGITDEYVSNNSNVLTTRTLTKNTELYDATFNKDHGQLRENVRRTGEPVVLLAPSNDFTIYPFSNQGGWTHKLYVKVGDNDPVMVYHKTWTFYGRETLNGDAIKLEKSQGKWYVKERAVLPGIHIQAPIGTRVEIYLDEINGNKGQTAGTTNGMAIYLDCNVRPEGVELLEDAVIKYIGIEDNPDGDNDFNDVVLAVVGNPFVPEKIEFTNDTYDVPLAISKRYMIEDLGQSDDFDFNDVVVDVTEISTAHHKVTKANGVITNDEVTSTDVKQKAVIRHLGGTLPFILKIGDKTFDQMGSKETFQTSPDTEYDITGWDYTTNNVSIEVNEVPIEFPAPGNIPMIFACDPSQPWAAERSRIDFPLVFPAKWVIYHD